MKNIFLSVMLILTSLFSVTVFSQSKDEPVSLGLPGDNLDLYAVMEIFQKSKTIEDFEKTLNVSDGKGVNNLDLDNDGKIDFIKVITNKEDDAFTFVLQVAVSKTENQDVAVILVSKDKSGKPSIQIVGDEDLYGKNYVVEPKGSASSGATANPGYTGGNSETPNLPATAASTTTVVVQSPPIVQYVYSPAYVPYYPPYYYGFYPPYFHPVATIAFGIYWSNHFYCHGGYYGGYHGSVNININNSRHYNNYNNNSRNRSNTVNNFNRNGNYKSTYQGRNYAKPANRQSNSSLSDRSRSRSSSSTRQSASTRTTRPSAKATRPSTREAGSSRNLNSSSTRQSSSGNFSRPSGSTFNGGGRSGGGFNNSGFGGGRSGGGMRGGRR